MNDTKPFTGPEELSFSIPFPPKELNPNDRGDRRAKTPIRAAYKSDCFYATRHAYPGARLSGKQYALDLTFILPDGRHRDLDNILAACKYGLDGVAMALGINDRHFHPITLDWKAVDVGAKRGYVILNIREQFDLKADLCAL